MPDIAEHNRKRYEYAEVYSSSMNALHAAFDALRRDDLADAEFQFNLVANALANTIGKQVVQPVGGAFLSREECEHVADWYDYIVDQGGEVPADEGLLALRIRAGAAS